MQEVANAAREGFIIDEDLYLHYLSYWNVGCFADENDRLSAVSAFFDDFAYLNDIGSKFAVLDLSILM